MSEKKGGQASLGLDRRASRKGGMRDEEKELIGGAAKKIVSGGNVSQAQGKNNPTKGRKGQITKRRAADPIRTASVPGNYWVQKRKGGGEYELQIDLFSSGGGKKWDLTASIL